jgi:hypothetical protein
MAEELLFSPKNILALGCQRGIPIASVIVVLLAIKIICSLSCMLFEGYLNITTVM